MNVLNYYPTKPVNLNWQTLFVILDFFMIPTVVYAFLRIQKFQRYLLYVFIPEMIIAFVIILIFPTDYECEAEWFWILYDTCQSFEVQVVYTAMYGGFTVFAIYLVRKWSIEWNKNK